jgi:short-subunit dehydrogenase
MKKVALITGGSSGIGYALAEQFSAHGYNLLLVSHSLEKLQKAATALQDKYHNEIAIFPQDLRNDTSAEAVYGYCRDKGIEVEVLVNNAGCGTYGPFVDTFVDDNEAIVQMDVVTLIDLTYLFLHDMLQREKGYILNVASTAAFQPGPYVSVYYAAKAFVLSFTEAISEENQGTGVVISCLCPGPTNTPFLTNSGMGRSNIINEFPPMDPNDVAKEGYAGLMKGQVVIIPGRKNRFRAFCARFFSHKYIRRKMKKIAEPQK